MLTLDALESVGTYYHDDLQVYPVDILPPSPKAYRKCIRVPRCAPVSGWECRGRTGREAVTFPGISSS